MPQPRPKAWWAQQGRELCLSAVMSM
jgi:hypothetical protein